MSFVPILVALGTSCAFELKRASQTKGPALAPDVAELKASEARLKKLMTVRVCARVDGVGERGEGVRGGASREGAHMRGGAAARHLATARAPSS